MCSRESVVKLKSVQMSATELKLFVTGLSILNPDRPWPTLHVHMTTCTLSKLRDDIAGSLLLLVTR